MQRVWRRRVSQTEQLSRVFVRTRRRDLAESTGNRLDLDDSEFSTTDSPLRGLGRPRRVFETHVDGDIILRTDGGKYGDGILYQVDFRRPGEFATTLGATVASLSKVNKARQTSKKHKKKCQ